MAVIRLVDLNEEVSGGGLFDTTVVKKLEDVLFYYNSFCSQMVFRTNTPVSVVIHSSNDSRPGLRRTKAEFRLRNAADFVLKKIT